MIRPNIRRTVFFLGCLAILIVALACAKTEQSAAPVAPAPAVSPTPAAAPVPRAPVPMISPSPTPAVSPSPRGAGMPSVDGPLVPGGPSYLGSKLHDTQYEQDHTKYHGSRFPLWTKATYGGEYRPTIASWNPSVTLDPFAGGAVHDFGKLLHYSQGLCSMAGRDADFSVCKGEYGPNTSPVIVPGMFQSWEQPTPTSYVFQVRKGIMWPAVPPMNRTDREVTAQDIVWWLELCAEKCQLRDIFALVRKFEATDRYTVKIALQQPQAEFIRQLVNQNFGFSAKECYEEKGCFGSKLISPGAFRLKENVARQRAVYERNPEYYLKGLPYVERLAIIVIADAAAQQAAFVTRQTDFYSAFSPGIFEILLKQVPDVKGFAESILIARDVLRPKFEGPLADVRVRRALAMSVDHKTAWDVAYEGVGYFPTLVSRELFGEGYTMALEQAGEWYQFNPQRAKQLMVEAGYPNGFSTMVSLTASSGYAYDLQLFVQAQWKKHLGVDLKIKIVDAATYPVMRRESSWSDFLQDKGNVSFFASADESIAFYVKGSAINFQKVDDPVINDLYAKERGELDPVKRLALIWQFEQYELSQVYVIRLGTQLGYYLMASYELNGRGSSLNFPSVYYVNMLDENSRPKR
ncbi:MAG: ABC transporter substrate-binding protein [Dehalococcoidia bacterium]|nr:ABC transporter substrate-binding protein [Dehalococcoidia bacterium]